MSDPREQPFHPSRILVSASSPADRIAALEAENARLTELNDKLTRDFNVLNQDGARLDDKLRARDEQIAKAREALEFYADDRNYRMNGPLDPNSSYFKGNSCALNAIAFLSTPDSTGSGEEADAREWLIRKGGYYYRPRFCGYTTSPAEAGRYTKEEAEKEAAVEPWHMKAVHENEVCASRPQSGEEADAWTPDGLHRDTIRVCAETAGLSAWTHLGEDAYSRGLDKGARDQVMECAKAIRALAEPKGERA
jgi:hypothetical protein